AMKLGAYKAINVAKVQNPVEEVKKLFREFLYTLRKHRLIE
ncbi:unnamed protein product, partial [marine sediment metagenome]